MSVSMSNKNSSMIDYDVCVKSIIIGDSGVGKSSLLYRYAEQDWNPHYIATIGVDFKVLTFERNNEVVKLQLWDTAGQERFRTITHSYYRGAHGVMVVFDVTDMESFENVASWLHDVERFGTDGAPVVLIGNKCDCVSERVVPHEMAVALAEKVGCKYVEASAKTDSNVQEAFTYLVDKCVEGRGEILKRKKKAVVLPKKPTAKKHNSPCEC